MVAVDQGGVDRSQGGKHVEAEAPVEVVATGERPLVLRRVELGLGVDDVQLGVGAEVVEHPDGGLTPQRADLDDTPCPGGVQDWCDGDIPQREHDRVTR